MAWQAYAVLAGYQILSGMQQADAIRENAKITKQINELNAQYAEVDAWNAEQTGATEESRYQTTIDKTLAAQKVGLAAQDVDVNFGTAAEIQAETKLTGFLNQLDIRNQAHAKALGYTAQARNYRMGGAMQSIEAEAKATATRNTAIIGGASTSLTGYEKYKGKG